MNIPAELEITAVPPAGELPREFQPRTLRRRALQAIAALGVLVAIVLLAPGLGEVRDRLADAGPGWLVLATLLEGLSFASYVVMFGPIFCTGLGWRRSWQIGGSELAMGSLVPASGAGGLALGRLGPSPRRHARRADRPPLGRLLSDQERGELPRRRRARGGAGARPARAGPVAVADRLPGGRGDAGDRRRGGDSPPRPRPRPRPGCLRACGAESAPHGGP